MIEMRACNPRGVLCGESQPACRHPDATVALARELRSAGLSYQAIADALGLKYRQTVWQWVAGGGRKPAARIIVKRIKAPKADISSATIIYKSIS